MQYIISLPPQNTWQTYGFLIICGGYKKGVLGTNRLKENMRKVQNYSYKHVMTSQQLQDNAVKSEKSFFNTLSFFKIL